MSTLPSHEPLAMPALSPTMSQGNIVAWKKKEGDAIQPGDVLCEVETDKATMEWEAQEEGFLAKIVMPEGSKDIPLGQIVAILVEDEADVAAFKDYSPDSGGGGGGASASSSSEAASSPQPPPPSSSSSSAAKYPTHDLLSMPALSPTMSSGNIMSWNKKEGDAVSAGDVLAEVETDKATMEWEAQEDGFVAKILVGEGSKDVPIGVPVLVLVTDKEDISAFKDFNAATAAAAAAPPKAAAAAPAPSTPPLSQSKPAAAAPNPRQKKQKPLSPGGGRIIASPYAQKLAAQAGVALASIGGGSGPNGRIVAADVEHFIASGGAVDGGGGPAPSDSLFTPYTDISNTQIRKVTAKRLLESKQQVPHYYLTISARIDQLMTVRKQLNDALAVSSNNKEGGAGKLSLNDFVIKAAALACKRVPEVNASWQGDFIRQYNTVDCSVAVQTPLGLMVPIIKDADSKGLAQIAADVKDLAGRAKAGKLKPEEFTGGTFTVSNLGMFGISQFAAIVNPPQAAILAVGAGLPKVVPASNGGGGGGQFETGTFMQCTLSCDHRVVDGAVGAQWLASFKGYLENPATMLLG